MTQKFNGPQLILRQESSVCHSISLVKRFTLDANAATSSGERIHCHFMHAPCAWQQVAMIKVRFVNASRTQLGMY